MKEKITKNGIDYVLVGDYYIPDLKLPEEERSYRKVWTYVLRVVKRE